MRRTKGKEGEVSSPEGSPCSVRSPLVEDDNRDGITTISPPAHLVRAARSWCPRSTMKVVLTLVCAIILVAGGIVIGRSELGWTSPSPLERFGKAEDGGGNTPRSPAGNQEKKSTPALNMVAGFEEGNGQEGEKEWIKCRTYEETELGHPKQVGRKKINYDMFLPGVRPSPGAKWALEISDSVDLNWLGLHGFDDRYKHGSEEADRRVEELGYCRVHMPSVPRTGSTWFRAMFETATSQPSFSMWPEGGTKKKRYDAFSSDDPCGGSLDHMEGRSHSKKKFPCRDVRPPNGTSPIIYKSHTPYFPSFNRAGLMPDKTCVVVLLVRNPIDNQEAWQRYVQGTGQTLRDYLPVWQGHLSHWIASAVDIPIYVFRYEDMLLRSEDTLRRLLQALPGGWNWSDETIAKAVRLYGPKQSFEDKCGSSILRANLAEVEMVRQHYGAYMQHYGYRFVKQ